MLPKGIACNKGASWNTNKFNTAQYQFQIIYRIDKAKVKGKYKNKEQTTNNDTEKLTLTKNRYRA